MQCPACGEQDTRVVDSRSGEDGSVIRRRRKCPKCRHRFSTIEEIELLCFMVVKKDGHREPYSREKLESGIRKALEKRAVPEGEVREVLAKIERKLQASGKEEIPSKQIGALVMRYLKDLDEVAYIRFASVYKSFKDADTFEQVLKRLKSSSSVKKGGTKKKK